MNSHSVPEGVNSHSVPEGVNSHSVPEGVNSHSVSDEETPKKTPQSLIKEYQVRAALKVDKGKEAELVAWEVVDFTKKGDNYACIVTSVEVTYRQGGREQNVTYVVKCNPCRSVAMMNDFVNAVFEKEAKFYQELVPMLNAELKNAGQGALRVAPCYYAHLAVGEEIIMLQDLRPQGFKMFDRKKGMDVAHATLVLKELGRLHAASVLMQAKCSESLDEKFLFLQKDFTNFTKESEDQFKVMFQGNFDIAAKMAEMFDGYEIVVKWLRANAPNAKDIFEDQIKKEPPFDILCHGDCWNNNILFKYDERGVPVDVRLIDLQICRQASPATDLNYLMYTSLNGAERKENLSSFLHSYYTSFSNIFRSTGAQVPFTLEELCSEYHRKNPFGFIMGLMVIPIVLSEGNEAFDPDSMTGDDMEVMMKEFQDRMMGQMRKNPLLRPRLLAMFDDMVEYGVIS